MRIDALVAEIGSTTTVVSAFQNLNTENPLFLGQGFSETTVQQGDVTIGLTKAIANLQKILHIDSLDAGETFAVSSAAGGLKMSVHGLVYDMTVKAAKEAALGAGANLRLITSGILSKYDMAKIQKANLNIIMIAGGVDYGEQITALENARSIAKLHLHIPIIYAGNIVNQEEVSDIFKEEGEAEYLTVAPNVYPKIDILNVEPVRLIIQNVFEKHITKAPGMEAIRTSIHEAIIPTPGAVLEAALLLQKEIGNLVCFDVGGATTDIHSVTSGSPEVERILISPEPFAKRTVEGDLGVFINKDHIIDLIGKERLMKELNLGEAEWDALVNNYRAIPDALQIPLTERLTYEALAQGIERHAGKYISLYSTNGMRKAAEGKDLTNVKAVVATGGALTRLPNRISIIRNVLKAASDTILKPQIDTPILIDNDYIMAALGVLSKKHPKAALTLLKKSLGVR
jgi:uncharacterized protein (TIGR01319 family)